MSEYRIREEGPADAGAVAALGARSADGGAVGFRVTPLIPSDAAEEPGRRTVRVVAEDVGAGIVGAAAVTTGTFSFAGAERPFGLLSGLSVDPAHRRRGIGAALARARIDRAERDAGEGVVLIADIQRGNAASLAAARRWATAWSSPAVTVPIRMRTRPPERSPGLTVREAGAGDIAPAADGWARFAADREFARIRTAQELRRWLSTSPFPDPVDRLFVAYDDRGAMVSGLAVRETGRLRTMTVTRMPATVRMANALLHVVPADGVLRNIEVDHFWAAPGRLDAARALWEHARWAMRDSGTTLVATLDARDPMLPATGRRPWSPTTSVVAAVRSDVPPRADALFQPFG